MAEMNDYAVKILGAYVGVVDYFLRIQDMEHKTMFTETKKGEYLNFKPSNYRKGLEILGIPKDEIDYTLLLYRNLGFIVTMEHAYTNIQVINDKSIRVITVRKAAYESLKKLGVKSIMQEGDGGSVKEKV